VEEVFEARPPKGKVIMIKTEGVVDHIEERGPVRMVSVKTEEGTKKRGKISTADEYLVPSGVRLLVKEGDKVAKGTALWEGPLDLRELLVYRGLEALQRYIVNEVQKIYVPQGATINDKHIEIIVRQMLSRVLVKDPGDTDLMPGDLVERMHFIQANRDTREKKKTPAKAIMKVLGITRVALDSPSFLSAASFQETSRVLVKASVEGKSDPLRGLKENVIIGKLIPAGTGRRGIPAADLEPFKIVPPPPFVEPLAAAAESTPEAPATETPIS
jgi:DNA-directed RNA polymerase subunit beta'